MERRLGGFVERLLGPEMAASDESGTQPSNDADAVLPLMCEDSEYGGITAPAEQQRGELADQAAGYLASKNIGWGMELEPDVAHGEQLPPITCVECE
eukprot:SAG31_NODE_25900_length_452_cov_0.538244_1_plen_96_part_10